MARSANLTRAKSYKRPILIPTVRLSCGVSQFQPIQVRPVSKQKEPLLSRHAKVLALLCVIAASVAVMAAGTKVNPIPTVVLQHIPPVQSANAAAFQAEPAVISSDTFGDAETVVPAAPAAASAALKPAARSVKSVPDARLTEYIAALLRQVPEHEADARDLAVMVVSESVRAGFDPLFILAVMHQESGFRRETVSAAGARGLFQIKEAWGPKIAALARQPWEGQQRLLRPDYSLRLGVGYLKHLKELCSGGQHQLLNAFRTAPSEQRNSKKKLIVSAQPSAFSRAVIELHQRWKKGFEFSSLPVPARKR
jgi:hypothetical protein